MASLEQKKLAINQLADMVSNSMSVIAADYRGVTSKAMTELRAKARKNGAQLKIVRNTLAKRVLKDTKYQGLLEYLYGPVLLVFSKDEPSAAARILRDFSKEQEKFSVTALALEGKVLAGNQLDVVANLPTKHEALAKLVTVIQAPITKFVRTLAEPQAKLVRILAAIKEQK